MVVNVSWMFCASSALPWFQSLDEALEATGLPWMLRKLTVASTVLRTIHIEMTGELKLEIKETGQPKDLWLRQHIGRGVKNKRCAPVQGIHREVHTSHWKVKHPRPTPLYFRLVVGSMG